MVEPVGQEEQKTGDEECTADENGVGIKSLHPILHRQHQKERQRAENDKEDHPTAQPVRLLPLGELAHADHGKELQNQRFDLTPIGHKDGHKGAQMEQHIKEHVFFAVGDAHHILEEGQMAGAGNGQKLGNALNEAKKDCGKVCHMAASRYR